MTFLLVFLKLMLQIKTLFRTLDDLGDQKKVNHGDFLRL